jgi:hypothetical protein
LAAALKGCAKLKKGKRAACDKHAETLYGPKKGKTKRAERITAPPGALRLAAKRSSSVRRKTRFAS